MYIQPLPEDAVAQITSSAAISSLNGVVYGLLQNSLDAGGSKISITVDYNRGSCSVEDNGDGIAPASLQENGGLGKLHYTSRYPPRADCHGKRGEFLACLGALSLLSIASHHRDYRTHNSLTIHNSRVVARNLPAPPEQRVLASASGTRVVVKDLFGSMPVRVKQRAIELERVGSSRDFEQLIFNIVSLLLPWPGEVAVTVQDLYARRSVSLRASEVVDWSRNPRDTAPNMISRTTTVLSQASLMEHEDSKSWVPIGATTSGICVRGCVSLRPVATKRVQFIALGIQPLPDVSHSNFLCEEINRVFEDSSFGVLEETGIGNDGLPGKTEGFTGKELKPKRGIDRWPMFFLQITLGSGANSVDVDDFLDEKHQTLLVLTDLLQVMAYEFLKKHHFRPKAVHAIENLRRRKSSSLPPTLQHRTASHAFPSMRTSRRSSRRGDRGSTPLPYSNRQRSKTRSASPFGAWPRIKPNVPRELGVKGTVSSCVPSPPQPDASLAERNPIADVSQVGSKAEKPLFDYSGNLLRKPFDDADETPALTPQLALKQSSNAQLPAQAGSPRQPVVWIDPTTKIKSSIDPRTGFALKPKTKLESRPSSQPQNRTRTRDTSLPDKGPPAPPGQNNTVFQQTEPPVPRIAQVSETLGCEHGGRSHQHQELEDISIEPRGGNLSVTVESRISKAAFHNAQVLGQVDQKFILAKVAAEASAPPRSGVNTADHMLILIDQHAADERCQVEHLFKSYFVQDLADSGKLVAQTQHLDKPLRFDLPRQDGELLVRFRKHFAHWGIVYEVILDEEAPSEKGRATVTVEAQMLPPSILERCRLEPRLLIDLLRKEIWKLHDLAGGRGGARSSASVSADNDWVARFYDCPEGILDLINSRACRSAIMFNDHLTVDQCSDLVRRLADCAFPFQCAHGRPSMVPLVHLGHGSGLGAIGTEPREEARGELLHALKAWKHRGEDHG